MDREFAVVNATLITESAMMPGANLVVRSGEIEKITASEAEIPREIEKIDASGKYVSPGFVDVHIHGIGGFDGTQGGPQSLLGMSKVLVRFGTTTYLPTLVSMPIDQTRLFLEAVKSSMQSANAGARVAGAHLEGPFINPSKKGVHREEYLQAPSLSAFRDIVRDHEQLTRIVTLAPELNGAFDLIKECRKMGTVASMGHTNAKFTEAMKGIEAGITHSTHTFNGMSALQSREPGAVGAALLSDKVMAEIIADGIHLSQHTANLAIRLKGPHGIILMTDAVSPAGTEVKEFEFAGVKAYVRDGGVFTSDGSLCGSTLTLDRAVRNVLQWTDLSLPEVVCMASLNPAKQLGIAEKTGSLAEGKYADIVILDEKLNVTATFIRGTQVYPST